MSSAIFSASISRETSVNLSKYGLVGATGYMGDIIETLTNCSLGEIWNGQSNRCIQWSGKELTRREKREHGGVNYSHCFTWHEY